LASNPGVNPTISSGLFKFRSDSDNINRGISRHYESEHNARFHIPSREKCVPVKKKRADDIGSRIKALRTKLQMNQSAFAVSLGANQGTVSNWEKGKNRPTPDAFVRIAKLAEDPEDKMFFLDQAGVPDTYFLGSPMPPEILMATTEVVAKAIPTAKGAMQPLPIVNPVRKIPLLKNPKKLGTKDALEAVNIDDSLPLPAGWFPQESAIHAVKFSNLSSLFTEGEIIGLIDVHWRDPDRLIGQIVAVRTEEGIEPMKLRKDGSAYLLLPLRPNAEARLLRPSGNGSIVGRLVKWIADAPGPDVTNRKKRI